MCSALKEKKRKQAMRIVSWMLLQSVHITLLIVCPYCSIYSVEALPASLFQDGQTCGDKEALIWVDSLEDGEWNLLWFCPCWFLHRVLPSLVTSPKKWVNCHCLQSYSLAQLHMWMTKQRFSLEVTVEHLNWSVWLAVCMCMCEHLSHRFCYFS